MLKQVILQMSLCTLVILATSLSYADDDGLLDDLSQFMKRANVRHMVLSDNIARVNIPGEKANDLEVVKQVHGKLKMKVTKRGHMSGKGGLYGGIKVIRSPDSYETTINGNNISLEEQAKKMSDNEISYRLATELFKKTVDILSIPLAE